MFAQDRTQLRQLFFSAWRKFQKREPAEPLEQLIAQIILQHPEYHALLQDEEANLQRDYLPETGETNPFLHMAMHISIQEQLATQRPAGITKIHADLLKRYDDPHVAEHQMMECLAEMIWQSQQAGSLPDEQAYLKCLQQRLKH